MTHEQIIAFINARIDEHEKEIDRLSGALALIEDAIYQHEANQKDMLANLPGNKVLLRKAAEVMTKATDVMKWPTARQLEKVKKDNGPLDWPDLQKQIMDILRNGPHTSGDIIDVLQLRDNRKAKQAVYNIVSQLVKNKQASKSDDGVLQLAEKS